SRAESVRQSMGVTAAPLRIRLREAFEEAVVLPLRPRGVVGHALDQRQDDAVELGRGFGVDLLVGIVGGLVVNVAHPVAARGLVGRPFVVAEFEGERRDALAHETVLVAAGEAVLLGLLVHLYADAEAVRRR